MGDSYVMLFLNSSLAGSPMTAISLFFLFLARMLPIISLSPFFGSRVLPHPVKMAFAICLFAIYLPQLVGELSTPLTFDMILLVYFVKELFIGIIIGNLISLPFIVVQSAGIIIDHQRGGSSLMVNDPTIQNQSSPIGTLFNFVLIYIFYMIDGPWEFLQGISISYEVVPPDQLFSPYFFNQKTPSWETLVKLLNQVMWMTTQLAMPALLAMLMTDSFLGIANRLAPQVQITFLGMPLKSLLGLTMICLGWKLIISQMIFDSHFFINQIDTFVRYFDIGKEAIQ